jgi:hypothetical protein
MSRKTFVSDLFFRAAKDLKDISTFSKSRLGDPLCDTVLAQTKRQKNGPQQELDRLLWEIFAYSTVDSQRTGARDHRIRNSYRATEQFDAMYWKFDSVSVRQSLRFGTPTLLQLLSAAPGDQPGH